MATAARGNEVFRPLGNKATQCTQILRHSFLLHFTVLLLLTKVLHLKGKYLNKCNINIYHTTLEAKSTRISKPTSQVTVTNAYIHDNVWKNCLSIPIFTTPNAYDVQAYTVCPLQTDFHMRQNAVGLSERKRNAQTRHYST
jgi:hypothetical protein